MPSTDLDAMSPPRLRRADGATVAAIYVVVLTVVPSRLVLEGLPLDLTPASIVTFGMTALWLCGHLTNNLGMTKGPSAVRTAFYCYAVAVLATYAASTWRYLPADELKSADHALVLVLALVGMALLVCDGLGSRDRIDFLLRTVVVSASFVAAVGALQFVNIDLTHYLALPGLRYTSFDGFVLERNGFRRVAGTTANPIEFAVLCAMVLPLAVHYSFRPGGRPGGGASRWWWVCSGLLCLGLLFSISRSAVLSVGLAATVLLLGWPGRRRRQVLTVAVAGLAVTPVVLPGLLGTFLGLFLDFSSDPSIRYRVHDYPVAAAEFAAHPWFGRGTGTFYAPKHLIFDNQYLLTLVEAGIVGLLVMIGLFLVGIGTAFRIWFRSADDPVTRDLALSLMACLIVPIVGGITYDLLSFKMATGLTFLLIAVTRTLLRTSRPARATALPPVQALPGRGRVEVL